MKYFNTITKNIDKDIIEKYTQLLIENVDDLNRFIVWNSSIRSKQASDYWISFKTQLDYVNWKGGLKSFYAHENECENTKILLYMSNFVDSRKTTSLIEYCTEADSILNNIYSSMLRYLNSGKLVRTNHLGGYSSYDEGMFEIDEMIEIVNDDQIKNFILTGNIELNMIISKPSIYIENADMKYGFKYSKELLKKLEKYNINEENIEIFNQFKLKTILWKENDYISFFKKGLESGLENIIFESTFQDIKQFENLKKLLEHLMLKTDKVLNVYIKKHTSKKIELKSNLSNINIITLN